MAVKTFTTGDVLTASDTNTFLANAGWVNISATTHSGTASTINFNSVFTSTYANYRIVCSWDAAASGGTYCLMRMRVGGVDTTTTNYNSYNQWVSQTSNGIDRSNSGTSWTAFFYGSSGRLQAEIFIVAPQLTKNTTFFSTALDVRTADFVGATGAGVLRDTTAYDGFTFIAPGNVNGVTTIYGLRAG